MQPLTDGRAHQGSSSSARLRSKAHTLFRRPGLALLLVINWLCLLPITSVTAAPFDTCYKQLVAADADGNKILSTTEYTQAVSLLSHGAVTQVPAGSALATAFSSSVSSLNLDTSNSTSDAVGTACRAIYKGVLSAEGVSFSSQVCYVGLVVGDADRSGGLVQTTEYSRFVNYLSGGTVGSTTAFASLSAPLQQVFVDFASATTGEIVVTGSKPGETPTAAQQLFLADLCDQAAVAIHAGTATTPAPVPTAAATTAGSTTPAPVAAPTTSSTTNSTTTASAPVSSPVVASTPTAAGSGSYVPSFLFSLCSNSMAFSDLTRNAILESNEYVRFLNRLSSNAYASDTYNTLPAGLQANFVTLSAGASGIDIGGSAPGSSQTATQLAHLQDVCKATDLALQAAKNGGGGTTTTGGNTTKSPAVTSSPVAAPSAPSAAPAAAVNITLAYDTCVRFLALSDIDRNDALSDAEYVRFLTFASSRLISVTSYDQLDATLKSAFTSLAGTNSLIDVGGSKPGQTPTVVQQSHLKNVCDTTVAAMNDSLNPGSSPAQPTNAVNATVYAGWIVSDPTNTLLAASLRSGPDRQALDNGFAAFVDAQFQLFLKQAGSQRRLQQSGSFSLITGSAQNYQLNDIPCPQGASGNCVKVYSSFLVAVTDSNRTGTVSSVLQTQVMKTIPTDLQRFIKAADAVTPLVVVQAALPVQPGTVPGAVTGNSGGTTAASAKSGASAGAIVAPIIIILLLVGAVGGGYFYMKKHNLSMEDVMMWLPDIPSLSKRNRKDEDAKQTADIEKAAFGDDDEYGFEAGQSVKDLGDADFKYGTDDDDESAFSVMDQPSQSGHEEEGTPGAGKGNKFSFGLGKKKATPGTFDGAIGDMGVDAFNETAANDFADYGFDDPVADIGVHDDIFGNKGDNAFESAWGKGSQNGSRSRRSGDAEDEDDDEDDRSGSGSDSGSDDDDAEYDVDVGGERIGREPTFGTADMPDNMRHLDAMVDQGNWDGVMAAATKFDVDVTDGDGSEPSRPSLQESEGLSDASENSSTAPKPKKFFDPDRSKDDASAGESFVSYSSEELRRRAQYRGQVEILVKKVVPDEIDNIDAMMDQFSGREAELIHTLQTMEERTATQRARKAVHKSKAIPQRENIPFGPGGTEGSAAIAAASTIGVQVGAFDDAGGFGNATDDFGFGAPANGFDDARNGGSFTGTGTGSRSHSHSGSDSRSGSYSQSERSGSKSYYSDEQSGGGSVVSGSQYLGSRTGSQRSGSYSGSHTGSQRSGSYRSDNDDEGSQVSGEGSRSYVSGEASQTGSQRSGSYYSGDEQASYASGDGTKSYVSGDGSQSHRSGDEGSYVSREGSKSYRSGEDEGSYVSGEGSRSYRSGEDEGSYVSGEGSKSYRSGEDEGSYVSGEGSKSYRSGADEGSYVSGEGSQSYRSGEEDGSFVSGEGSQSYRSGGDDDEGSHVSGEGSQSYRSGDDEGSYVSGQGSQSYRSGENDEGSYVSGEGSRSYVSGDGTQTGSYVSGERSQTGSYVSGEGSQTGSYVSGDGSQSGSYVSGEGSRSRSVYSDDDDDEDVR
jgi:hypothetical protein